jgi:hypothetical protein
MHSSKQVALFFQRTQTIGNLLAAVQLLAGKCTGDGWEPSGRTLPRPEPRSFKIIMSTTVSLVAELERIASTLSDDAAGTSEISLASVAEKMAKTIGVRKDEVGILAVSARWRHLHFLVPESLKRVGFIPLSSNSALAARTARDGRPEIDNNFSSARHATVFEGTKISGELGEAIQKIISAPIFADGKVIGVIQVSRKGSSPLAAGPDFTTDELGKILALCEPLGKLLQHLLAA